MRHALALGLAGVLGGISPALGETPVPTFDDKVVVTASAVEEEREEVPSTVTVIDAREIEARQFPPLSELIATAPGVAVATAGPPGQQTSTFVRGAESDQTLLLWNGVALNGPYFGGANWQLLPTDGAERVEVARGPFSALWGGNAVGGVVQVLTGAWDGARLTLEGGEDGYFRTGAAGGHDFGRLRLDGAGSLRRGDSEFENGFYDGEELLARLKAEIAAGMSLSLVARAYDSETGIPFSSGLPNLTSRIDWKEREIALPWQAEWASWSLSAQLSEVDSDYAFRDPEDPFGFTRSDTDSEARRGRALASYRGGERWWAALGGEVERVEVTDVTSFGVNLDAAHQQTWAAFGQGHLQLGEVTVDLGLRRDDNDVFGAETSARAGLVWSLSEAVHLRASYGEAFRPPTLGELFFPFSGNPDLKPEESESVEAGVEVGRGALRLEVVAFELDQENLIDFALGSFRFENVSRAESRGIEAALAWRSDLLRLRLAGTYLEAENRDTGDDLLRRPQESASLVATFLPRRWSLTGVARYVGDRPDFDPASGAPADNPSYLRLDLAASFQAGKRLSPYARIENLADEEYAEVLGYPAPGRTLVGGVHVAF
jgi:vitamin B12 transporter